MGATGKVSVPALRILTFTILIKAATDAVMLACTVAAGVALRSGADNITGIGSIYVVCQSAGFINVVACVMCLGGIASLSKHFVSTLRIMVAVLLIECFVLVPATAGMLITLLSGDIETTAVDIIMLSLVVAERLLIGAAFLFLMRGFGDCFRECGDSGSASSIERLGVFYCCLSVAGVVVLILTGRRAGVMLLATGWILSLAMIVLELIMYRSATEAAQQVWRKRAFSEPE